MSFSQVRHIGVSILASAGVIGIVVGFAAQKTLGNHIAGIQIAITQPIRVDDVIIVEDEWGWMEKLYFKVGIVLQPKEIQLKESNVTLWQ
ncbi:MAG: mechanosensitive ion channel family protein [Candidatus Omnitrophica bacterium]|nr:mechanosensitive ion channel family protein [Candidatus Omnitrophota bacterium]